MKLGIAYNVFNGDELLLDSLKRLRKHASYIIITFQKTSNVGNKADESLSTVLQNLDCDLVDGIIEYKPNFNKSPKQNETNKRQLGLKFARKAGCTHFMSTDCDEFYIDYQFVAAKKLIIQNGYKSTACELVNYFHSAKYKMIEKTRYVPFIYEIGFFTRFSRKKRLLVSVDSSRVCRTDGFHFFQPEELLMHHMSYVRENVHSMKSKLINSPNYDKFENIMNDYLDYYSSWTPDQPALNPHDFIRNKNIPANVEVVLSPILLSVSFEK